MVVAGFHLQSSIGCRSRPRSLGSREFDNDDGSSAMAAMPEKQNSLKGQDGVERFIFDVEEKITLETKSMGVISSSTPHLYTEHRGP